MPRPETARDVLDLVRRARLVGEARLAGALDGATDLTPDAALGRLVAAGLLTRFQAAELAAGRGAGLWLGVYKVLDPLGQGGMSHVFLAEHAVLGKRVAVKVLSAALKADPEARRRFVREARAAAAIDHPNVVRVYDVDIDHDPPFLVMEPVDGVSLQAAVARHGAFTAGEAAAVGVEVARGLEAAAAAGLVHRDVKPANLLVDRRGGVKLLDLGIVRLPDESRPPDGAEVILGTLDYLAPEQAVDSAAVDARADLYALGATLYFLLAGHPPFPGPDVRQKLAAKLYTDPPPVHRLRPDVGPGLSGVVQSLLARDPAARCPTAAAAADALTPFAAPPTGFPARLFRPANPSTAADDPPAEPAGVLPPTQVIRKPPLHPSPPPLPPTDLSATPLPTPLAAAHVIAAPEPHTGRRWRWVVWAVAAGLVGAALVAAFS